MSSQSSQSEHEIGLLGQRYSTKRYPFNPKNQLRPWGAADIYLVSTIEPHLDACQKLCIANDNFGASAVALVQNNSVCYGDSWMSLLVTELNMRQNHCAQPLDFEKELKQLVARPEQSDLIVGCVQKFKTQLTYPLQSLNKRLEEMSC